MEEETMMSSSSKCICVYMMNEYTRVHELGVFSISDDDFKFQPPREEEVETLMISAESYDFKEAEELIRRTLKRRRMVSSSYGGMISCCSDDQVSNCRCCPLHDHEGDPLGMGKINIVSSFYCHDIFGPGLTIVGSTVYLFGPPIYPYPCSDADAADAIEKYRERPFHILKDAYKLDISSSSGSGDAWNWEKIPPMNVSRQRPEAVVVDQQIFVFGGILIDPTIKWNLDDGDDDEGAERFHIDDKLEKWAEVFDTSTQKWELLPPPPKSACDLFSNDGTISLIVAALNHPKKCILVGSPNTGDFCTYMVTERRWDDDFVKSDRISVRPLEFGFGQAAVFKQTLYLFTQYNYELVAYDIPNKLWLRAPCVHGLSDDLYFRSDSSLFMQLVHLYDNLFGLLWTSHEPVDTCDDTHRIHCAKIRISKEGGGLRAVAESCQSYTSDHYINFRGGWLMDGIFAE